MPKDVWHFQRYSLAKQILEMFNSGLSTSLIFFAPRRMGKTEFLLKDIKPLAEKEDWLVFYFSFLDAEEDPQNEFTFALHSMIENKGKLSGTRQLGKSIKKIGGRVAGVSADIEFDTPQETKRSMKQLLSALAKKDKTLLLLDEIQILAKHQKNEHFVAGLRTVLDTNKDYIKVIFTGSSREGLRQMFSESKAPFFHFGQNLPFPELDSDFTDHLARVFESITGKVLNAKKLWTVFKEVERVPQVARSIVERLVLNPILTIEKAKNLVISEIFEGRAFEKTWGDLSIIEQCLLFEIANESNAFFGEEKRAELAKITGIQPLGVSRIQSAMRTLQKKLLVGRLPERGNYYIDDPHFRSWIIQNIKI